MTVSEQLRRSSLVCASRCSRSDSLVDASEALEVVTRERGNRRRHISQIVIDLVAPRQIELPAVVGAEEGSTAASLGFCWAVA